MLHRLRSDFLLSMITMLGTCGVLGVAPFAVYRFYSGDMTAGIVDTAIIISFIVAALYAWHTGDTRSSGTAMMIFSLVGGLAVSAMQPGIGIFWMFPIFVGSFFLTTPRVAIVISGIAMIVLIGQDAVFSSPEHMMVFLATGAITSACAYIFAARNEAQRDQLERLATFDPLTGVRNRRAMDAELQYAVATAARTGVSYTLAMLDLDHFKRINDTHGHRVGDRVLIQCAQLIQNNIRETDRLFRFGGEEFVILLTGTQQDGVAALLTKLHRTLALELMSPNGPVTASFGTAQLQQHDDWESWLARADATLYRAKDAGRDCIILDNLDTACAA